jgi:hypothetical protein
MCDPMTYPLLFPNGDSGWHPNIPYRLIDERRGAEENEEEEEERDSDELLNDRERCVANAENEDDDLLDMEEIMGDPEDQSASRKRDNEILEWILLNCVLIEY